MTDQQPDPPSVEQTPTYQLADLLLRESGGIVEFVASRRIDGMAWRRIARELYLATDKRIDVAHETLRNWFPVDPRANGDTELGTKAS